ncbi:MAG: hypothetical protein FJ206_06340 [Gemmatimonadetes bacterium]|nr:hypothetical protein [Gemmatimonadota bacterium]
MPRPNRLAAIALAAAVATAIAGCATTVELPPPPDSRPLIEAILVAGQPPLVRVRSIGSSDRGSLVDPAQVRLRIGPAGGNLVALASANPAEGTFGAPLSIEPGRRYRLEGTVGSAAIRAETLIPASLEVIEPAGPVPGGADRVPYRLRSVGATVFSLDHGAFEANRLSHSRDTVGGLFVAPVGPDRQPAELTFFALNRDGERYLFSLAAAEGNVAGALGVFGGAIAVRRPIRWP